MRRPAQPDKPHIQPVFPWFHLEDPHLVVSDLAHGVAVEDHRVIRLRLEQAKQQAGREHSPGRTDQCCFGLKTLIADIDPYLIAIAIRAAIDAVPSRLALDSEFDIDSYSREIITIFDLATRARDTP
jgi:hypothetical protein